MKPQPVSEISLTLKQARFIVANPSLFTGPKVAHARQIIKDAELPELKKIMNRLPVVGK